MTVRTVTEAQLQSAILEAAKYGGWLHYHNPDSRRSTAGFPDLVLVHPTRHELIFAELKSSKGRVRPEQQVWLDALATVTTISEGVIRPENADALIARLVTRSIR